MRSFFVRFIAIGVLFHLYVGMRIIPDAFVSPLARTIAALVLASFVVLIPVGMFSRRFDEGWAATLVGWAGALAMG
ncbi:metallophosphoesterase, partial [Burkholderia sp. BCCIQ07D]|nr:metallophosphoesterase [Burkholderia anthinoferrum]